MGLAACICHVCMLVNAHICASMHVYVHAGASSCEGRTVTRSSSTMLHILRKGTSLNLELDHLNCLASLPQGSSSASSALGMLLCLALTWTLEIKLRAACWHSKHFACAFSQPSYLYLCSHFTKAA